jgi:hypothetical protein
MGGDSCGSDYSSYLIVGNPKIFRVHNILIGCCGSFRVIDLLRYRLDFTPSDDWDADRFMRTTFIDAVRECFKEGGYDDDKRGGNFLAGYRGRLYEIQPDYSILNAPEWGFAVGSGETAARGSLYTTRDQWDSVDRIQTALEAAEAIVPSVKGPFVFEQV